MKKYTVRFGAFTGNWPPRNFDYQYSLEEAESLVREWKIRADTVGGDGLIEEVLENK